MNKNITIDEVETTERIFLSELISRILQLSYASCCHEAIWDSVECEGCQNNWPSQKDHLCILLCDDEQEAWYYYYDDATQKIDSNIVWNRTEEVAEMLEIKIHPSWKNYIPELYKEAQTTIYLYHLQFKLYADSASSTTNRIINVLNSSHLDLTARQKTLTKAFLITYPEK